MSADSVFDVGTADMVEITIGYIDERGMSRKYDGLAGDFVLGIAEVNINTVGTSERKLGIDMLACARVLGLLNNDHLIFIHLLSNTECRRECSVAGRTLFKALKGSKRFGDEEYAALGDGNISIHVTERTRGTSRDIGTVGIYAERNAESGMTRGKALLVELLIACHVKTGKVNACADDLCIAVSLAKSASGTGKVAAACVGADNSIGITVELCAELLCYLVTESFDTGNAEWRVQRSIEVAGLFKKAKNGGEKLGAYGELNDLCTEGFAFTSLFNNLGLTDASAVIALLNDDAFKTCHCGMAGNRCAVVSAGGSNNALIAELLCLIYARAGTPCLKASAGVY